MNIGKNISDAHRKYYQTFANQKFVTKTLIIYLVCAVIPILCMMYYYYYSSVQMLSERAYQDGKQNTEILCNSIEMYFQPYESIIERYKNDRNLNTLLSIDYTGMSYNDLAYYTSNQLDETIALYPEITGIRFYNNNSSLPRDDYFFFSLSDLSLTLLEEVNASEQQMLCVAEEEGELFLLAKMNYYSSSNINNYIALKLKADELRTLLPDATDSQQFYLIDTHNVVFLATDDQKEGQIAGQVVAGWMQMQEASGYLADSQIYYMKTSLDQGMTLLMLMDDSEITESAQSVPMRILTVFAIFIAILTIPAVFFGRHMNERLEEILTVTNQIGQGNFEGAIKLESEDELGLISREINRMSRHIDRLIRENYLKELEREKAEMNLMQEQINPHFLYNALAVISSMAILEKAPRTKKAARSLSDFYRISLNKGRQIISVAEEVELLKNYVRIQDIRFEEEIEVSYQMEEGIEDCQTVKLVLQPLVENAIIHARSEDGERLVHIRVSGVSRQNRLVFVVEDDGVGMDDKTLQILRQQLQEQASGFGLKNVDKRIKLHYGPDYGIVSIESTEGKGTRVQLEIPLIKESKNEKKAANSQ